MSIYLSIFLSISISLSLYLSLSVCVCEILSHKTAPTLHYSDSTQPAAGNKHTLMKPLGREQFHLDILYCKQINKET